MIWMKQVVSVVLAGVGIAYISEGVALAGPDASPSARAAARLKHHPPQGWINHYLPDDRYKIQGGVWRFVSTETDDRYYLPNSSYMLSQPPGIVIGFADEAAAQEAGYRPGPDVERRTVQSAERLVAQRRALSRRPAPSLAAPPNLPTATAPTVISIPASQIPPHILAFIGLVDQIADDIEATSSGEELLRISMATKTMARDFRRGMVATYLGGDRASSSELTTMMGVLQQLAAAADNKREPGPVGFGASVYRQQTNSARAQARNLIPQVGALRQRQFREAADRMQQETLRAMRSGSRIR